MDTKIQKMLETSVLASPPDLLFKIISSLDSELNSRQIGEIIGRDQGLSAQVLKLSNSSYFGFRGGISSLEKAINILGTKTVRNIAVSSLLYSHTNQIRLWNLNMMNFWLHSFIAADLTRDIALLLKLDSDEGYIAGLLHDIGKLILYAQRQEKTDFFTKAHNLKSIHEYELSVFGIDSTELGKLLLERWNIPKNIVCGIAEHQSSNSIHRLARIINLANEFASAATDFYYKSDLTKEGYLRLAQRAGITTERRPEVMETIPGIVDRSKAIMKVISKNSSVVFMPRKVNPRVTLVKQDGTSSPAECLLKILGYQPSLVTPDQIEKREVALKALEEAEKRERLALLEEEAPEGTREDVESREENGFFRSFFSRSRKKDSLPETLPPEVPPPSAEELKAQLPPPVVWNARVFFDDSVMPFEIPRPGLTRYRICGSKDDISNASGMIPIPYFFANSDILS